MLYSGWTSGCLYEAPMLCLVQILHGTHMMFMVYVVHGVVYVVHGVVYVVHGVVHGVCSPWFM